MGRRITYKGVVYLVGREVTCVTTDTDGQVWAHTARPLWDSVLERWRGGFYAWGEGKLIGRVAPRSPQDASKSLTYVKQGS